MQPEYARPQPADGFRRRLPRRNEISAIDENLAIERQPHRLARACLAGDARFIRHRPFFDRLHARRRPARRKYDLVADCELGRSRFAPQ